MNDFLRFLKEAWCGFRTKHLPRYPEYLGCGDWGVYCEQCGREIGFFTRHVPGESVERYNRETRCWEPVPINTPDTPDAEIRQLLGVWPKIRPAVALPVKACIKGPVVSTKTERSTT